MREICEVALSPFTPDAVAQLAGSGALAARRLVAAERFGTAALPTTEEEVWRYSRIDELDLDRHAPAVAETTVEHGDLGKARVLRGDDAAELLGALPESADALLWLHHALVADPIVVDVPAGATVAGNPARIVGPRARD